MPYIPSFISNDDGSENTFFSVENNTINVDIQTKDQKIVIFEKKK